MTQAHDSVHEALSLLLARCPLLARLALSPRVRYKMTDDAGVQTACVTRGGRVHVSRGYWGRLSPGQRAWLLAHELAHLWLAHHGRLPADDRGNVAADLEANQRLPAHLPACDGALTPAMLGLPPRLTAEQYLALLPEQVDQPQVMDLEASDDDDCDDGSVAEIRSAAELMTADMRAAAAAGDTAAARMLGDMTHAPPAVPRWLDLARQITAGDGVACASRRWSRRTWGRRDPVDGDIDEVVVIVDVSGSIDSGRLADMQRALERSPLATGCVVAPGTTHLLGELPLRRLREALSLGPGGTDMARCWRQARARWPRREVVIVTDGQTPWPDEPCTAILTTGCDVPPTVRVLGVLR